MSIYIRGSGAHPFGKSKKDVITMAAEAATYAIENGNRKPEFLFVGSMLDNNLHGVANIVPKIADAIGLNGIYGMKIDTASSTGAALFQIAAQYLAASNCTTGLVIASERMTGYDGSKITSMLAQVLSYDEQLHGATMPGLAALIAKDYMKRYNAPYDAFSAVAIKNHRNGLLNPIAHFKKEITMKDIMESRVVADPLRVYDCAPVSDGAVAVMISKEKNDVELAGFGGATDTVNLVDRDNLDGFRATQIAAKRAYDMAKINSHKISIAEIHDAFTPFELIGMEDLNIAERGNAWKMVLKDETALNGRIPVNGSGGLKARGHPVSVSGLAQIMEISLQLSGMAEKRQVDNLSYGIAQSTGGLASNNFVTILRRSD